jgi:hypothetical protein
MEQIGIENARFVKEKTGHIHVRLSKNKYEQAVNFLRKLVTNISK